jgi:hypothetical protein
MSTTIMTTLSPHTPTHLPAHLPNHSRTNPSVHLHADGLMTARRLAEIVLGESPYDDVVRAIERAGQRLLPNFSRDDVLAEMFRDFCKEGSDADACRIAEALKDKPFKVWCPRQSGQAGGKSFLLFI